MCIKGIISWLRCLLIQYISGYLISLFLFQCFLYIAVLEQNNIHIIINNVYNLNILYMVYSNFSMTLTQTERGFPPPVEHVGIPNVVRKEKGRNFIAILHFTFQSKLRIYECHHQSSPTLRRKKVKGKWLVTNSSDLHRYFSQDPLAQRTKEPMCFGG